MIPHGEIMASGVHLRIAAIPVHNDRSRDHRPMNQILLLSKHTTFQGGAS